MPDIPSAVRRFVETSIDNLEQLEVLLLVRRSPDLSLVRSGLGAAAMVVLVVGLTWEQE